MSDVSIHAPTQGATGLNNPSHEINAVSIHAPTQGATNKALTIRPRQVFQSTRPRRARLNICCIGSPVISVSIHAPTQGATLAGLSCRL